MHTIRNHKDSPFARTLLAWVAGLALFFAGYGSAFAQASSSAVVCAPAAGAGTSGATVCAFDSPGIQAAVLSTTTLATPLAITNALSGMISGRRAAGGNRVSLQFDGHTGAAAAAASTRWNGWFALGQNQVGYSFQPLQTSGNVGLALGGVDYTFGNNVILGVAASWDRTRVSTTFNSGSLNGNGYMLAPYVAVPFGGAWVFDASVGFGRASLSQVDNSVAGGLSGSTTDQRFFSALGLSYAGQFGKWQLMAKGNLLSAEDKVSQFTLSNGGLVPANTARLSQLRAGAQAAYDAGTFIPYAGLYYVNDIQRANQAPVNGVAAANDRDGWVAQLGVNIYSRGAVSGGLMYSTEAGRSQVKNNQFMANIAIRF